MGRDGPKDKDDTTCKRRGKTTVTVATEESVNWESDDVGDVLNRNYIKVFTHVLPMFPLSRASANRGLFCCNSASWSGFARNMSLIITGSSSTMLLRVAPVRWAFLAAPAVPGTWMLLKSKAGTESTKTRT